MFGNDTFTPAHPERFYFGIFLSVFCSLGVLLNISAIVLLLLHTRLLARNQRLTVLNVAFCDLMYALLGTLVSCLQRFVCSKILELCKLESLTSQAIQDFHVNSIKIVQIEGKLQ